MATLILTALLLVTVLLYGFIKAFNSGGMEVAGEDTYRNGDGDHIYYERSIIEKKLSKKLHPSVTIRSFAKLFKW